MGEAVKHELEEIVLIFRNIEESINKLDIAGAVDYAETGIEETKRLIRNFDQLNKGE